MQKFMVINNNYCTFSSFAKLHLKEKLLCQHLFQSKANLYFILDLMNKQMIYWQKKVLHTVSFMSLDTYILLDGLSYNTRGSFASCVVFFQAPQGRGKMRAMSKMSASIIC